MWGWDCGEGAMGMGEGGWERGDGSVGMGAWGWERGNEAGVRTAVLHERLCEIFIFLSNPFYLSFFSQFENRVSLVNIFSLNILYATIKVVSVGTEHEVESMRTRIRG